MDLSAKLKAAKEVIKETDTALKKIPGPDDPRFDHREHPEALLFVRANGYERIKKIVEETPKKEVGRGVRPKYVDEHFPRWHKFGGWMEPNGKVGDVCADGNDIVNSVTEEVADKLIKARNEFVDKLQEIFDEHPDQFNVYGPPIK